MNPLFRALQAEEAAARLARAVEQGYTIDAYKGSLSQFGGPSRNWKGDIVEDKPWEDVTHFQHPAGEWSGFFSNKPEVASSFAEAFYGGKHPAPVGVFPTKLKMENPFVIDAQGKPAAAFQFENPGQGWSSKEFRRGIEDPSFDGVILKNTKDEGDVYVPKTPQQVRSRFAQFKDPTSKDLLAAKVPVGAAPENEGMSERQRRRRNPVFGPPSTEESAAAAALPMQEFFTGGPAPMEPDLLATQQGAVSQPGQTRRPNVIPITTDAETGRPMLAMPRLLDMLMSGTPSTLPSRVAPVAAGAGEVVLGAGGAKTKGGGLGGLGGAPENKTYWSELSKTKLPIAVEDMTATRVPTGELAPRKVISPEALENSILMPAVWDRTAAGANLTHINGNPLFNPVKLEGGPDFMRGPQANSPDRSISASGQSVISKAAKWSRDAAKEGLPVNYVYSAMGARSGDFSTMMSDALLAQMPGAKVPKKVLADFDASMRSQDPKWPGINDPKIKEVLLKHPGLRKTFAEELAQGHWQEKGFPEIGSTRAAISEPALLGQPTGASGYAIAEMDPAGPIITNPKVPHSTYPVQLGGKGYLGGLEQSVPREIMFPDFYKARRAEGIPTRGDDRSFSMADVRQKADAQWLDQIMRYLEARRQ